MTDPFVIVELDGGLVTGVTVVGTSEIKHYVVVDYDDDFRWVASSLEQVNKYLENDDVFEAVPVGNGCYVSASVTPWKIMVTPQENQSEEFISYVADRKECPF